MRARTVALLVAALGLPLAGCLGGDADVPGAETANATAGAAGDELGNVTIGANATAPSDLTGGHAPHIHNYWGEADRITLYDDDVSSEVFSRETFVNLFLEKRAALGGATFELPDGATVYEGTGQLVLTADWTDATITSLAARYHSPDMKSGFLSWSPWTELQKGQPFTIEVTPAMTDMPHDAKSRWAFAFAPSGAAGVAEGVFRLKVEIVRMGDIMVFPGHPDTYQDTDRYVLADQEFTAKASGWPHFFVGLVTGEFPTGDRFDLPNPVPMETRALVVEVHVLQEGQTAPLAEKNGIFVAYTTADSNRDRPAQLLNATEDAFVYGIPVEDRHVDSPYLDGGSAWHLHIRPRQAVEAGEIETCRSCFDYEVRVHVKITAYNHDPTGGEIEPARD